MFVGGIGYDYGAIRLRMWGLVVTAETLASLSVLAESGLGLRQTQAGPEQALVCEYLQQADLRPSASEAAEIFVEPRLDGGFPDVVVVYFEPHKTSSWPACRRDLVPHDLRLLQSIIEHVGDEGLVCGKPLTARGCEKLESAGLLRRSALGLHVVPPRECFAATRIIAIEAKMTKWDDGLFQAAHNTRFASESYLLLSALPVARRARSRAKKFGVGLLTPETPIHDPFLVASQSAIPKSHVSWLFNEWAWKARLSRRQD